MLLVILLYILRVFIVDATAKSVFTVGLNTSHRSFPENFLFGASSAAYQIEGGWDSDGKGESIWDEFTHSHPERIADRQNGDVGANSYEHFLEDIEAVKSMNMNFYRFSISWPRILPTGDVACVNEKGIEYYNKIIDKLVENQIEPMITIYHFDLPKNLQTFGGFMNSLIVKYYKAYANLLFDRFGDRVKYWITFNEPAEFCVRGYGTDQHAPGVDAHGIGEYLCVHNILKAHAVAYRLYHSQYYDRFQGQVGIACDSLFYYSETNDAIAVNRAMQFSLGWIAHPIFSSEGNYPSAMIEQIGNNSMNEGWSRLPTFSEGWLDKIHGSADFLGINYYTSRYIEVPLEPVGRDPSFERDKHYIRKTKPEWVNGASEWLYSVPQGLGDILRWTKHQYNNPQVIITENGWSDRGELEDNGRVKYLHDHLKQVLDVLDEGCHVKGYAVWSLIDNFEWSSGFTEKFGMYSVNMSSPRKERTPKKSSHFMTEVTTTHRVPDIHS